MIIVHFKRHIVLVYFGSVPKWIGTSNTGLAEGIMFLVQEELGKQFKPTDCNLCD